jgi:hypothetical protein
MAGPLRGPCLGSVFLAIQTLPRGTLPLSRSGTGGRGRLAAVLSSVGDNSMGHKDALVRYKSRVRRAKRRQAYLKTVEVARVRLREPGTVRMDIHNQYNERLRARVFVLGDWTESALYSTLEIGA